MKKAFRWLDKLEEGILILMMAIMTIAIVTQVVSRVVFHNSLAWTEEIARYILVWVTFVGASLGVRKGAHIGVEAFTGKLPARTQKTVQRVMYLICTFFCLVTSLSSIRILLLQAKTGQVSAAVQIPMWLPYLGVTVGVFMMAVRFLEAFAQTFEKGGVNDTEAPAMEKEGVH
uniref:TRAP transporter small permease n=1 Tax=Ndongobacter massiliensis TaxID=1871025 RepID=UPI00092FFA0E|nr:TRAP transporter small permease [Ndongobacter massiliensis]